ncbi:hypothetical protein PR048_019232 [Dryococelus australis]|uniref:Uncharacterized protein n=1 Tax=Dryococelus australis TaxID=614101 RepID=A0ABQ9H314_9NEOP|nr:hypothetical protein PR048_019232 [Dryococelus australis]
MMRRREDCARFLDVFQTITVRSKVIHSDACALTRRTIRYGAVELESAVRKAFTSIVPATPRTIAHRTCRRIILCYENDGVYTDTQWNNLVANSHI